MVSEIQARAVKASRGDPRQRGQERELVNRQLMRNAVAVLEKGTARPKEQKPSAVGSSTDDDEIPLITEAWKYTKCTLGPYRSRGKANEASATIRFSASPRSFNYCSHDAPTLGLPAVASP